MHQPLLVERLALEGLAALRLLRPLEGGGQQHQSPTGFFRRGQIRHGRRLVHSGQHGLITRFFDEVQTRAKGPGVFGQQGVNVFDLIGLPFGIGLERVQFDELVFLKPLRLGELGLAVDQRLFHFADPPGQR